MEEGIMDKQNVNYSSVCARVVVKEILIQRDCIVIFYDLVYIVHQFVYTVIRSYSAGC